MNQVLQAILVINFLIWSNMSLTQDKKTDFDQLNYLIEKAQTFKKSQSDSCLIYAKQAEQLALEHQHPLPLIESYLLLADYHWKQNEYKNALEYAYKAEKLAQNNDYKALYARAIIVIADVHLELGDSDQKFNSLFEALNIYTQLDDTKGKSHAYISISGAHYKYGKIDKAIEYCQKSLEESRKINDLNGISRALNNLGAMYMRLNQPEKGKSYYLESAHIAYKMHDKLFVGVIYLNLSRTYSSLNKIDSSFYYLEQAMEIFKATNNTKRITESHILLAYHHLETQNYDQGFADAKIALEISETNQLEISIANSSRILQKLYEVTGDTVNAYKYSQIYHHIRDSVVSKSADLRIEQIEMKYAYEHALLEKESEQKHKRLTYITIFTAIVALMSLALMTIYFKSKMRVARSIQEKVKLESELEIKHKELTTNTMSLLKTNKTLNEITDHLIEVLDYDNLHDTQSAINVVINTVKQATRSKVWKEFEMRFQQVHSNFNENLLAQFPKLTALDLRLCALLRLNLTTKEISELTGQRTSSLEIARSRLRKKLGITDRSTNLVVFLSSF